MEKCIEERCLAASKRGDYSAKNKIGECTLHTYVRMYIYMYVAIMSPSRAKFSPCAFSTFLFAKIAQ